MDSSRGLEALCKPRLGLTFAHLQYAVHVYSPVGKKVGSFQRPASVLGVKELAWSPNGRYLALGGYDGIVRVLESESWQPISVVGGFENGALAEAHRPERNAAVQCEC